MHLARILLMEGQSLPKHLFLDVMIKKTQILVEFVKNHHLGRFMTILQWAILSSYKLQYQTY